MPAAAPKSLLKDLTKCKHPNSRRTKALSKKAKKFNNRDKIKLSHAARANVQGEQFAWFQEQISGVERADAEQPLTGGEFDAMIELYLRRFDEELEQIALKQSISKGRQHQHHSRLTAIRMTQEKERGEYGGGGWMFIDLTDAAKFKAFMAWDGNAINLQHYRMELVSKKKLVPSMDTS